MHVSPLQSEIPHLLYAPICRIILQLSLQLLGKLLAWKIIDAFEVLGRSSRITAERSFHKVSRLEHGPSGKQTLPPAGPSGESQHLPGLSLARYLSAQSLPGSCRSSHKHGASPTYPPFCKGPQGRWHGDGGWAAGPACHLLATFTYRTPFPLDTQTAYRGPSCMSLEGLCSICSSVLCKKCLGLGVNGLLESLIALNHS